MKEPLSPRNSHLIGKLTQEQANHRRTAETVQNGGQLSNESPKGGIYNGGGQCFL